MKKLISVALALTLLLAFPFALDYASGATQKSDFIVDVNGEQNANVLMQQIVITKPEVASTSNAAISVDKIDKIVIELEEDVIMTTGAAIKLNGADISSDVQMIQDNDGRYITISLKNRSLSDPVKLDMSFAYKGSDAIDRNVNVDKSAAIFYSGSQNSVSDQVLGAMQYQTFSLGQFNFTKTTISSRTKHHDRHINSAEMVDLRETEQVEPTSLDSPAKVDEGTSSSQNQVQIKVDNQEDKVEVKTEAVIIKPTEVHVTTSLDDGIDVNLNMPLDTPVLPKTSEPKPLYVVGILVAAFGVFIKRLK